MDNSQTPARETTKPFFGGFRTFLRRTIFFGGVLIVNIAASLWLTDLFWLMGFQKAHYPLLVIFIILNGLLTLGSFHAIFGAIDMLLGRKQSVRISKLADGKTGPLEKRHAVVMPVYNEDSVKTCARIEAIYRSIEATGNLDSFDFFILSDTRDLNLWVMEETSWTNLCRQLGGFGRIYYRRRKTNENRKAGNIGDFVRTWGGNYESMLVLDADSLMDGADIVKMTRIMEAYPRLGILQTPPKLIRGSSVFTRLQQFAMRLYGPLFIRGLNFWQLMGGSYWGHNALIRVQPFSEFCELPALPGREPFGGRILSHDFVEAALMVSQGWEVWLAWDIEGTFEEAPPTLVDHLIRDRRWCQGNLQHMWLIFARKLPFSVRMHLFMGIMAYLGSPVWFLFLALGTWVAWDRARSDLSQLPFENYAARWFDINGVQQSLILTGVIFGLLFLPKILAVIGGLLTPSIRRSFGGGFRIIFGAIFETIVSMLLAPCIMVAHTLMVLSIIAGRAVGWGNQNRETDGTSWGDAFRFHAPQTILGIAWTGVAVTIGYTSKNPAGFVSKYAFVLWMTPILLGLLLAAPVSVWTSRTRYGKALLKHKLLATPEEISPPSVMTLADNATAAVDSALDASVEGRIGVVAAVVDPYVNGVHVSLLEHSELTAADEALAERCLSEGPGGLSKNELSELLYLAPAMLMMHRAVWLRSTEGIHSVWTQAVESYRRRLDHTPHAESN
ncbi:glucans biosynthesis glucosyltransferase MdoH [Luteolibacter yonseiensis]|uniref:Glucans biosynthesis glucosyltransferase H n=1 Tax=Luteolibacter yonseiensis TaxID=1144680 RepID=A0A934R2H0_9BACT|nr:glucans biosynthesis glucosyltransferase MdoH [Luteolibacter yonseiensis]MBK1815786.1 glucans biosynthesis glucosyltransferase MdoH [Luteolibacter yonseiensis]